MPRQSGGTEVTVVGLGRMGGALAKALLASGRTVTVWNRNPAKAAKFTSDGARIARSLDAAIRESTIVLVCLSNYRAWFDLLAGLPPQALSGRLVAQLSTGAPDEAVRLAQLHRSEGARSLDGAILAFPDAVGTARCTICMAGSADEFSAVKTILGGLGDLQHVGEDIQSANALDAALLIYAFGARIAYLQAAAVFETTGLPLDMLANVGRTASAGLETWIREVTPAIVGRAYEGDQATLFTFHGVWSMARAYADRLRLPTTLLTAFETLSESAIHRGHGEAEFPAMIEALRRSP